MALNKSLKKVQGRGGDRHFAGWAADTNRTNEINTYVTYRVGLRAVILSKKTEKRGCLTCTYYYDMVRQLVRIYNRYTIVTLNRRDGGRAEYNSSARLDFQRL